MALDTFSRESMDGSLDNTSMNYHGPLFDALLGATPSGELSSKFGVLQSYSPNADATAWTLKLKPGIKWHDGVEMTSEDVKFTLEWYARREANTTASPLLRAITDRIETTDRYTAVFYLKRANAAIPATVLGTLEGLIRVLPKHVIDKVGPTSFDQQPVGSGPWKFAGRKLGEFIEFDANTEYWAKDRVPRFAKLRLVLAPDPNTRVAMLKRGEADLGILEPQQVEPMKAAGFRIMGPQSSGSSMVSFAMSYDSNFICNKLEMRKALALGIDMDAVVKAFYPKEVGSRYGGAALFIPTALGHDSTLSPYAYDPTQARELLRKAGYNGETVEFWSFTVGANPEQREVNEVIAGYWRAIGVTVRLVPVDFAVFRDRAAATPQRFDPPCPVAAFFPSARPSLLGNISVYWLSGAAGGFIRVYWNPAAADAQFKQLSTITDLKELDSKLRDVNKVLYQEYWAIPIATRNITYAAGPKIDTWAPISNTHLGNLALETLTPRQ